MVGADVGGRAADRGTSMNQLPWEQSDPNLMSAAQRRRSAKAAVYVDLFAEVHFSAHGTAEHEPPQGIAEHLCRSPEIDIARPAQQSGPPCICEFILCLVVEPKNIAGRVEAAYKIISHFLAVTSPFEPVKKGKLAEKDH
jgi:hypothetical protein